MTSEQWRDQIVGDRIAVDREFADRIGDSALSNQQWELVMTAVEFEIEHPTDPERASLVANTDRLRHVADELERIDRQRSNVGGTSEEGTGGGLFAALRGLLRSGSRGENEHVAEGRRLASAYADELQGRLEARDAWEQVCERAAAEQRTGDRPETSGS